MNTTECTVIKLNCKTRSMIGMYINGSARQPVCSIGSTSRGCACSICSKCLPALLISLFCLALAVAAADVVCIRQNLHKLARLLVASHYSYWTRSRTCDGFEIRVHIWRVKSQQSSHLFWYLFNKTINYVMTVWLFVDSFECKQRPCAFVYVQCACVCKPAYMRCISIILQCMGCSCVLELACFIRFESVTLLL